MKKIVIFASGNGTNAQRIIEFFQDRTDAQVVQVLSNNPRAKVLERATQLETSAISFNREALYRQEDVLNILKATGPDVIILAGFLWLFPEKIISAFPDKVLNIHPSLLPEFGGKGMYGKHVHEAVYAFAKAQHQKNPEKKVYTGITIHKVTPEYDKGGFLFQQRVEVDKDDTPKSIAEKIHLLEYEHFPKVIAKFLS
ncbi:phosphoribosylglycinamide formyltransferase [Dokdonia sp. Hel_I_53]|uniref:phosphoribosylglycinamide formyltransferase n=1 Tax=Dokdonia sp. Hel_I_53 TaxID=1566287 RepID=UPI00119B7E82|nr:phosphoribosylglycinamide formyltransferase [Dokdonia sp. Hel_I_53]TVZ52608.1 formyltetrahydrofolate-dependent phosphoribosylglycinamide formyltransferase [Dokdonia sp. Hel_I_53]